MAKPIKVLIVDDSALIRQLLSTILSSDPGIQVVGTAPDPYKARALIKELNPDVLTLDVEMPKMNGIEFLKKIMKLRPMPVVMISALTQKGAEISLQALEIGAVEVVGKPQSDLQRGMAEKTKEIITKVKVAAGAQVHAYDIIEKSVQRQPLNVDGSTLTEKKMILIGASTGGVEALRVVLSALPPNLPPIFVVQHMPRQFTGPFAQRLNTLSTVTVEEAEDGVIAQRGHVYIAQGDKHFKIEQQGGNLVGRVYEGEPVGGHIPAVSVLFDSALEIYPNETIAVMLSGMGKDGAQSMLRLKEKGASNVSQDEKSCVVYGMPKAAYDLGAIDYECDLKKIPETIISLCGKNV